MPVRIAVVDDTKSVRDMLVAMLSLDGFEVVGEGASAEDAVRIASEQRPDVMVIDYLMPDGDGIEASVKIKQDLPGQPIILYTAYLDETVRKAADSAGIVCVNKAEGMEALERAISDLRLQPNGGPIPRSPSEIAGIGQITSELRPRRAHHQAQHQQKDRGPDEGHHDRAQNSAWSLNSKLGE